MSAFERTLNSISYRIVLDAAKAMVVSIVGCRLDYCNSVLYGMSQANIDKLQRVQNILAWVVVGARLNTHRNLHWLLVDHLITYKLCLTTWKTLHISEPVYLSKLISHYFPSRSLHSSSTDLLTRPAGITSNFFSRAFSVSAPSTWNSLPAHIRSIDTLSTFKRHLKFHLFQSAFTV